MGSDTELTYEADSPETRLQLELPGLSGRSADALLAPQAAVLPDSDSGDSLFQTQPVTLPLRLERRERDQLPSAASESDADSEGDGCPKRSWESLLKFQRYKPNQETRKRSDRKGPVFQFLAKKNNKSENLPWRKVLLFEQGAIGGFFTHMKKVKEKSEKGLSSRFWSLRRRFLDEDGELLPLSNPEQAEDNQASADVKSVAQTDFILKFHGRFRGHNTWIGKSSSDAGEDSTKDGRKASSNQKKSVHVPKVQTGSRVQRSASTCDTDVEDDGLDNCDISTEREYDSDTVDLSSLSSDTSLQEEDQESTATDVLDPRGAVKRRKPTGARRSTHTVKKKASSAAVIRRSTPLDAETAGSDEVMSHSELQQSPDGKRLGKQTAVLEQGHLPERGVSALLAKEGIRKDDEALANQDVVPEAPLILHDNVHEVPTTAVNVQDEQGCAEHAPSQNTLEKPTDKMPQKIFEGSSGCEYELNKANGKKQQMSQEVILNLDDVSDLGQRGADSQNIGCESEGSEDLFDSSYGHRLLHGEERSVEEERTPDVYAQSTTDSQSRKPSVESACGKGDGDFFMWNSSKSERQKLKTTSMKDSHVEYTYPTENASLSKKKRERRVKVVGLQNGVNEEGRDSAPVAKSQSHSSSSSYNQTKSKQVISETSVDQISDIGSYPPEPKDNPDFEVACHDLEKRRRKKRERGEKEEQFSTSGSRECLSAPNSPMRKCSDRERNTKPVEESPLSSSDDVVGRKKKKKQKSKSAEESDELGGRFIANNSGHFLGGNNGARWNTAEDRSMEFESRGERSMTDPEHHDSEYQPSKKKHKKERDSDTSGSEKTAKQISSSKVTCDTGLGLTPGLQSETSRGTKAGKSHEREKKLLSDYDPAGSKMAGMDTDRDCHGKTTDIQQVSPGANAIRERSKVSQSKSRGLSLCDKEGHGTTLMVKGSPCKQRLFAVRRFRRLKQTGSYIHQTLIRNYLHSKKR